MELLRLSNKLKGIVLIGANTVSVAGFRATQSRVISVGPCEIRNTTIVLLCTLCPCSTIHSTSRKSTVGRDGMNYVP